MHAEAYLEPTRKSIVELLCENHEKSFIVRKCCKITLIWEKEQCLSDNAGVQHPTTGR